MEKALDTFSPREIQARVRAGASAEVIAADTGWPLEKVLRYAEPLLAERAFIAEQAQAVEIRRSGGATTLAASAAAALGASPEAIAWDARRRDDGKWIVTATFAEKKATRIGHWTYDHPGRNLHPMDDVARALMGVGSVDEAEGGQVDAVELIAERPKPAKARPRLVAVPDEPDDTPAAAARADTVAIPHPSSLDAQADDEPPSTPPATHPARKAAPAKPAKGKRGRASVPSWDEILFGSPHEE